METKVAVDTKQEIQRKQCSKCSRTRIHTLRMKEPLRCIPRILWQKYGGMVIRAKCFAGTRAA